MALFNMLANLRKRKILLAHCNRGQTDFSQRGHRGRNVNYFRDLYSKNPLTKAWFNRWESKTLDPDRAI